MDKSRIFVGRQHHGNCFSCCRWKPRNPLINAMGNRKGLHQPFALFHLWTMNENYEAYKGLGRNTYLNLIKIFGKKNAHAHKPEDKMPPQTNCEWWFTTLSKETKKITLQRSNLHDLLVSSLSPSPCHAHGRNGCSPMSPPKGGAPLRKWR